MGLMSRDEPGSLGYVLAPLRGWEPNQGLTPGGYFLASLRGWRPS